MRITKDHLSSINDLLKEAGVPVKEGQLEGLADMINRALEYSDEVNRQREAEMGPEAWAKMQAEMQQAGERISQDFIAKLQKILDSMEAPDKL